MNPAQIAASLIFIVTFATILSDRIHRTIVAMMGALTMLVVGMLMGFYNQEQALEAVDFNTLGLLMGMMILVGLLQRTGFFQYIAIITGKWSGGRPWLLLVMLGATTTVLSMFLDNVTTVVLIAPVTILIAEILGLNPMPLLMAEALLSNVGGVATLVGDPPNVLIGSAAGLTFADFLTHMTPLVVVVWIVALLTLRVAFRRELAEAPRNTAGLAGLNAREALHDPIALRRSLIVLGGVVLLFFLHGALQILPGMIALGGAAVAMLWVRPDVDATLHGVEWSILLFFAALFVTTGGLEAAHVLGLLATQIEGLARTNPLAACLGLLWLAAIVSAVVDNIPFTIALIPVIQQLEVAGIHTTPFWWALALGAGMGGNGTPIGATANVVAVTLSAKTRSPITTKVWLRAGLPVTVVTCILSSVLFALFFGWMNTP